MYKNKPKAERRAKPGRPPGIHTPHRTPQERRAYLVERYGDPVEYMLMVMSNPKNKTDRRDDMAKSSAPYVSPKLSAMELGGPGGDAIPVSVEGVSKLSDRELAAQYAERVRKKRTK